MMRHKNSRLILIFLLQYFYSFSQTETHILSKSEVKKQFTHAVRKEFRINFPIRRVYKCNDLSGEFYIVLAESIDSVTKDKDTLHKRIKALKISKKDTLLIKDWEINDYVINNSHGWLPENSIWFFTKYFSLTDLDNDSIIDPVIVYGSASANGLDDGRLKFLIYKNNKPVIIRHQNGILDSDRNTQIEKSFYDLPEPIQEHIKNKILLMMQNNHVIFPYGWEKDMAEKKLYFDER